MTRVWIQNQGREWQICIEGHAGYRAARGLPEGTDIVCAAVSILGQTAAQCFLELEEDGDVKVKELVMDGQAGLVRILAVSSDTPDAGQKVGHMVWTVQNGLRLLAEAYPEFVRFV